MAISWDALGTSVLLNGGVALGVFFIFNFLRQQPYLADFYAAKRKLSIPFRFRPPRLPPTWFSWMKPVFLMPDEEFVACAGFDALAYCRFLKLAVRMAFWVTVISCLITLPTNWAAGEYIEEQLAEQEAINAKLRQIAIDQNLTEVPTVEAACAPPDEPEAAVADAAADRLMKPELCDDVPFVVADFDSTSMSNISDEQSHLLWAHLAAIWIISILLFKMMWAHWQEALKWRILYLAWKRKGDSAHTILVQDIPGTPHGTIIGRIYDNIDGSIGRFLPATFKEKVQKAMNQGISEVFNVKGKVKGKMQDSLGQKLSLSGGDDIFDDRNLYVYRQPGDQTQAYKRLEDIGPNQFADPMGTGSFMSAESPRSTRSFGNSSFMYSTYTTPRASVRAANSLSGMLPPDQALDDASGPLAAYPPDEDEVKRPVITGRRNLRNFRFRKARTDFETWEQAEAAIQNGVSVEELVRREFARDFGEDQVQKVTVVKNELKLGTLVGAYEKKRTAVEELTDQWISALRRKATIKRKKIKVKPRKKDEAHCAKWGTAKTTADEMEYKVWDMKDALDKVRAEQKRCQHEETCAAFVQLRSRLDQTAAATGLLSYREDLWKATAAPDPSEVIWSNVAWRGWERSLRVLISWTIFGLMLVFMLPIIAIIQQIVNLEAYAAQDNAVGDIARGILDLPVVAQVLPGILPTLGLKIFLALVPIVLRLSAMHIEGQPSFSAVDYAVAKKFYIFQFIVVFVFVSVLGAASSGSASGSGNAPVLTLVEELADNPGQIADWIGTAVPQQASFYLQYILTNGLLAKGIAFLKIPGAAIYFLLTKLAGTKRQKKKCWANQYMKYGAELADHTMTVLLMLLFGVQQPFLALVALAYFVCIYFYARYDLLYTQREAYQSGGLFWPVIFDQIYVGVMAMLIGYFALFGIKNFPIGTTLMIPLIVIAVLFRATINSTFKRPMENLSIHAAADLDRADRAGIDWMFDVTPEEEQQMRDAEWDLEDVKLGPIEDRYKQPSLIVNEYLHRKALEESADVSRRVDAYISGEDRETGGFMLSDDGSDDSDHESGMRGHHHGPLLTVGAVPIGKRVENV
eukprot:jgi/Ulvmu1/2914/UM147_0012.1